jgi:hypothetical protein
MMPTSKLPPLLALLLGGTLALSACAAPATPEPTVSAIEPTAVPTLVPPSPTTAPTPTARPTVPPPTPTTIPTPTAVPNPTKDPITGAPALARGAVTQRPYVVMIDNHPNAYPQTGLDHAAVVFEALAEFGVTRFMAVYAPGITSDVPAIGPVRSTRAYFAQWAMGFHGLYAHAGGSPDGLALVASTDQLINLDALHKGSSAYFARSGERAAPHNLYTSSDKLHQAAEDRSVLDYAHLEVGFLFKTDIAEAQRPEAQNFTYYFIYKEDSAGWSYDPATNGYLRLRRGRPARDAATGEQLWTKNVIVIEVTEAPIPGDPKGRIEQNVIGTGRARLFQDGVEREITWRKEAAADQLGFYDDAGDEIQLNAGPVWIVSLPSLDNLTVETVAAQS